MDYPFEQLTPEKFQKFCQALLAREHKNMQFFPVGQPDGGRDATQLVFGKEREFLVYQVKFVREPNKLDDVATWLAGVVRAEGPKVALLKESGATQYVLITNLPGTGHKDTGSIDRLQRELDAIGLPAMCWWRNDLASRLDTAPNLKWVYPELLSPGDILQTLVEGGLSEHKERRTSAVRAYVQDQYSRDAEVKFRQVELQNGLLDLFIDVPMIIPREFTSRRHQHDVRRLFVGLQQETRARVDGPGTADFEYGSGSRDDEASVGAAHALLHSSGQEILNRIVLEGAPGQGKSTITQYVCQVHRMRLLDAPEIQEVPENHRSCSVRVPFRVDLRDLATWLQRKDPFSSTDEEVPEQWQKSLEAFLAAQVRYHSGGIEFTVADLAAVAKVSAVLLVFDGLDEVAEIRRRQEVVDEIRDGVRRLEANATSLQAVITSRPAAFANSPGLPTEAFPVFELASVNRSLIDLYSEKWIKAAKLGPGEARDVRRILKEKLDAPHLRDLARNPMQLAILLSLIHTRGASLPDKRTALYDSYVELFFNREAEKSPVVRDHRYLLINIHRYLAWVLHAQAETGKGAGSIRTDELEALLHKYLTDEGHDTSLVAALFTGMVERVVALVSRVEGTFEFEVQPLREYFAARFLYETAPYSPPGNEKRGTKPERFDAIARNFYWLNVARFYAGCYSIGELPSLIDRLQELVDDDDFKYLSQPRTLAAVLLSDWVFSQHPKSVAQVVRLILDGLGLRFVIASTSRRTTGKSSPLILPAGCGRDEVLARAMDILRSDPNADYAFDVVDLIRQNQGTGDVRSAWEAELYARSGDNRTSWLTLGVFFGFLSSMSDDELDAALSDAPLDAKRMEVLLRAHRGGWLETNEERARATVSAVERMEIEPLAGQRSWNVLTAFASLMNPLWLLNARLEFPNSGSKILFPEITAEKATEVADSVALRQCVDVVDVTRRQFELPLQQWEVSLEPWSAIAESARRYSGDTIATCHFAIMAASIRSAAEKCVDSPSLFDQSRPICRRARYGRLRAGTSTYWVRHFAAADTPTERLFVAELFVIWAGSSVVSQLLPSLDGLVSELSAGEWHTLNRLCGDSISGTRIFSDERVLDMPAKQWPARINERTAALVAKRLSYDHRLWLFDRYLGKYKGSDEVVLSFVQESAMSRLLSGKGDWKQHLAVIERANAGGPLFSRRGSQRFMHRRSPRVEMEIGAAREIIDRQERYPASLVTLAEMKMRGVLTRKIVPVAAVAERDHWFPKSSMADARVARDRSGFRH